MKQGHLARLSTDFVLRRVNRVRASLFGGDLVMTLVFAAVTQANVAHIDDNDELSRRWSDLSAPPPDDLRRPVSGYAIALTLGLPRETIRRKINTLIEQGWLTSLESGFVASAETHANEALIQVTLDDARAARSLFVSILQAETVSEQDAAVAAERPHLPRMISRASNAYCLVVLEELRRLFNGEVMTGLIFCAIVNANYRSPRPAPSEPNSDQAETADRQAEPITALALAESMGLPRETARRHIKKLEQSGYCDSGPRGLVIPQSVLTRPAVQATFDRTASGVRTLVQRLAMAGVLSPDAD